MLNKRPLLLASFASVALIAANIAPPMLGFGSQPAFAKNEKNNDDGGNRGNGGGNGNTSESASAKDNNGNGGNNGRSDKVEKAGTGSSDRPATAVVENKPAKVVAPSTFTTALAGAAKGSAKTPGLDAKIASLHAAHANLQAFIHASPNSKVGQIAAYAKANVAAEAAIAAASAALANLEAPTAAKAVADAARAASVAVLTSTYGYVDTSDAALQARQAALAATDTSMFNPAQLDAHNAEVAAVNAALAASADVANAQVALDAAAAAAATAEADVAAAQATADAALNAAANANRTPVDPTVKAWVDAQLLVGGVMDFFRTAVTP